MFQRLTISVVTTNKNKPQVKKLASPSSLFFFFAPFFHSLVWKRQLIFVVFIPPEDLLCDCSIASFDTGTYLNSPYISKEASSR